MSRLIVKGLPSNCTEEKLRNHFKNFGQITDCSLKYTQAGKFRRFAFIGFDSERNARRAREQIHNTFMGASRLIVDECKPFGDETKPRAWSKYAKGSSAYKRLHPEEQNEETERVKKSKSPIRKKAKNENENEKEYREFLELQKMSPVNGIPPTASTSNDDGNNNLIEDLLSGISGDTSLSLIITGLPKTVKARSVKDWFSPIKLKGLKIVRDTMTAVAFATFFQSSDVRKALQRSGQFLGGFKLEIMKVPSDQLPEKGVDDYAHETREAETEAVVATILETGRLFIRNLPYTCTDDDLQYLFKKYGEISELQTIISKKTGQCKGFAIVTFVFPECAVAAFSALDGSIFKGRMLHILPGEEKREKKEDSGIQGKSTFQKEKIAKLKKDAGKAHSWNTLFLGANAVAETLAEKLDVEKSDLLLGEGETSAGVRLALAETRLVREIRDYLLENGVCLDAFSRPAAKRSKMVIIVKNLPAKVDSGELQRMFERHGPVKKLLMPPGGISAIVEMENTVDAQKAFSALAYARFRTQPLYLEWAPYDVFKSEKLKEKDATDEGQTEQCQEPEKTPNRDEKFTEEDKKKLRRSKKHRVKDEEPIANAESEEKVPKKEEEDDNEEVDAEETVETKKPSIEEAKDVNDEHGTEDEQDDEQLLPGTTLFVKNLSFKTTDESLKSKFQSRFRIRSATISMKRDVKDPSKSLSMGFGFVVFYRPDDAQQALKEMQGILLDGHCLELKLSNREIAPEKVVMRKGVDKLEQGEATKILIRNIPFQATRKEVKQLFNTFGEIRSFRMPKKIGASAEGHRGFGFVDFLTRADARRAFNALVHSTHFYGRRLVLEWAKPDDDLEELREKAVANLIGNKKEARLQKKMMKKIEQDLMVIDDD